MSHPLIENKTNVLDKLRKADAILSDIYGPATPLRLMLMEKMKDTEMILAALAGAQGESQ